ncbi:hypothetical protein J5N97_027329 [Dioscorea zingiberensis]|uniref:F-box domain-containing protein n=1 Tax=Dioscorea zingiberensis TaxID=325984 RepID=A0A9D5C3U0_9LILI|nr:hypothetical protein J5N97_027329 [Dioscorea zingiberensis]
MARDDEFMKRSCFEDRLTLLPDVIRMHILSFLPRKYAIRTGTLSSQWRDLWKSRYPYRTTLDFNESFLEDKTPGEVFRSINEAMEKQGDSKIEVFNLFFYPGRNYQDVVTRWIEQAVLNGYIRVFAPNLLLRSLVFVCCWNIQLIELSAEFLQSFHFIGGSPSLYLLNTPSYLVDVVMISGGDEYFKPPRDWLNIILGINGVEVMTLCNKGLEFLFGNGGFTSCRLPRLRELQVIIDESRDDHPIDICAFLKKCFLPSLERLFIELPSSYDSNWHFNNMALIQSGAQDQQFEKLKLVKLRGFKKHYKEMHLLRFLFQKAVVLEQMVLVVPHDHDMDICRKFAFHFMSTEVSIMPKASPQTQIVWVCSSEENANLLPTHSCLPFKIID